MAAVAIVIQRSYIRHKPGVERGHAPDEVIAIAVVEKDRLAIDAARHDGELP